MDKQEHQVVEQLSSEKQEPLNLNVLQVAANQRPLIEVMVGGVVQPGKREAYNVASRVAGVEAVGKPGLADMVGRIEEATRINPSSTPGKQSAGTVQGVAA